VEGKSFAALPVLDVNIASRWRKYLWVGIPLEKQKYGAEHVLSPQQNAGKAAILAGRTRRAVFISHL
jgi:hypothetical protein